MTTLHDVGTQLRALRKRRGLSIIALSRQSRIHRNTLSALEAGTGNVELNTLLALCEQLELELLLVPTQTAGAYTQQSSVISNLVEDRPQNTTPTALQKQIAAKLNRAKGSK